MKRITIVVVLLMITLTACNKSKDSISVETNEYSPDNKSLKRRNMDTGAYIVVHLADLKKALYTALIQKTTILSAITIVIQLKRFLV